VACRHPSVQSEGSPALAKALLVQGTHCGAFALGAIQGNRVDPPDSRWRVAEGRHPTLVRPSHAASTPRACWEILPVGAHFSAVRPWRRAERPPGRPPGYRRRDPFVRGRSLATADLVSSDVRAADAQHLDDLYRITYSGQWLQNPGDQSGIVAPAMTYTFNDAVSLLGTRCSAANTEPRRCPGCCSCVGTFDNGLQEGGSRKFSRTRERRSGRRRADGACRQRAQTDRRARCAVSKFRVDVTVDLRRLPRRSRACPESICDRLS
jgi:hypothetical protein